MWGTGEGSGPQVLPWACGLGCDGSAQPASAGRGDVEAEMQTWASPPSRPASPRSSCRRQSCGAELPNSRRHGEGEQVQGLSLELLLSFLTQQTLARPVPSTGDTQRKGSALPFEGCHEGGGRKSRSFKTVVLILQTGGWSAVLVHLGPSHWLGAP